MSKRSVKMKRVKCKNCGKKLPKKSILRHISHSQSCKEHYGDLFSSMKQKAKEDDQIERRRAMAIAKYGNELTQKECECCHKRLQERSFLKHVSKSQTCKNYYGPRLDELKTLSKKDRCLKSRQKSNKWYTNLSDDKKRQRMEKQKERREALKLKKNRQIHEEAKQRGKEFLKKYKIDTPKDLRMHNAIFFRSLKKRIVESERLRSFKKMSCEDSLALTKLEEKVHATNNNFESEISKVEKEVESFDDLVHVAKKYDELKYGPSQSPVLFNEWKMVRSDFEKTLRRIAKKMKTTLKCFECYIYRGKKYTCPKCLKHLKKNGNAQKKVEVQAPITNYSMKRSKVNFTMEDLEREKDLEEDDDFE